MYQEYPIPTISSIGEGCHSILRALELWSLGAGNNPLYLLQTGEHLAVNRFRLHLSAFPLQRGCAFFRSHRDATRGIALAAEWEGVWEWVGDPVGHSSNFTWGKKRQHFCGLGWLQADISKFLPKAVSYSWKNLFGQPLPGLVTKSGHSQTELKGRGSFPQAFPQWPGPGAHFLTPGPAFGMVVPQSPQPLVLARRRACGPRAPVACGSDCPCCSTNTASSTHMQEQVLSTPQPASRFSKGSGFLGCSEWVTLFIF